jgi:hypothetical protein
MVHPGTKEFASATIAAIIRRGKVLQCAATEKAKTVGAISNLVYGVVPAGGLECLIDPEWI